MPNFKVLYTTFSVENSAPNIQPIIIDKYIGYKPVPVAVRPAAIVGSNPNQGFEVCVL